MPHPATIMLSVFPGNDVPICLYDSLGFAVVETPPPGQNRGKALPA